ncbi:hypothetical protein [Photorhabdus luminescens]|uniref:Uncharacterized protein n=1 Tax=Photorhabdus luminescens subsp. mexicana TaxID=2100167 RepID=A0A4R4J3H2_PHOLU|nr:hypothetical protein [Photorhabdus luminescens]TDB48057.1 hypothetical protein C5468_16770 [Photorhabdus luminescens subsp. mexicana]
MTDSHLERARMIAGTLELLQEFSVQQQEPVKRSLVDMVILEKITELNSVLMTIDNDRHISKIEGAIL